jgi:hypothetical protein
MAGLAGSTSATHACRKDTCVYAKRLERGRFAKLWKDPGETEIALSATELQLFLEGSELVGKIPLSPRRFDPKSVAIAA